MKKRNLDGIPGNLLEDILDDPGIGWVGTGPDRKSINLFSPGSEQIFGMPAEMVSGTNVKDLYQNPEERATILEELDKKGRVDYETTFVKSMGTSAEETIIVTFSLKYRYDSEGNIIGTLGRVRDITAEKRLEEERDEHITFNLWHEIEQHDPTVCDHSISVTIYSEKIARAIGMSEAEIKRLGMESRLHDIGKINVQERTLNDPTTFLSTDDDMRLLREHTIDGASLIQSYHLSKRYADVALYHHERFDGGGYPEGLKGEEVPRNARIVAIADAYDSMVTPRAYKIAMDKDVAIEELKRCSGREFDMKKISSYNRMALKEIMLKEASVADGGGNMAVQHIAMLCCMAIDMEQNTIEEVLSSIAGYRQAHFLKDDIVSNYLNRVEKNTITYLVNRTKKEMQFDPEIMGAFIKILEETMQNNGDY